VLKVVPSVFQHRRNKGDRKEVSIQADFAFLNTTGEIVADELTSKAISIDVHTDSKRAVGEIIGNSTGRYTFSIRRAAPQQHRSVGAAERTVRELKEAFSVLQADLNCKGWMSRFRMRIWLMF